MNTANPMMRVIDSSDGVKQRGTSQKTKDKRPAVSTRRASALYAVCQSP